MILFTILAIIIAVAALFLIITVASGGLAAFVVFGDIIVFVALIVWIVKLIAEKSRTKK